MSTTIRTPSSPAKRHEPRLEARQQSRQDSRPDTRPEQRPVAPARPRGDSLRDILRDLISRSLRRMTGVALIVIMLALGVALASWSVRDPSLNHAVDGNVRNWLGYPGAIVADVAIQLLGLAILAFALPLALWGLRLARNQKLDRFFGRMTAWVVGFLCVAGCASLLPRAGSWPLPTGLGGAVGDAIERLPLIIFGTSGTAKALVACLLAGLAIMTLNMAVGATATSDDDEFNDAPVKKGAGRDEDDHSRDEQGLADEPGLGIVLVGAAIHGTRMAARGMGRMFSAAKRGAGERVSASARQLAEAVTREDQRAYAHIGGAANVRQEPVLARQSAHSPEPIRTGRVIMPAPYVSPRMSDVQPLPEPVPVPEAPRAGYGAAVAALQLAARRKLGLATEAPKVAEPAPTAPADTARPGERMAIQLLQEAAKRRMSGRSEPMLDVHDLDDALEDDQQTPFADAPFEDAAPAPARVISRVASAPQPVKTGKREVREAQPDMLTSSAYELPPISLLQEPKRTNVVTISEDALEQNARLLESVLDDFGVKGEIINIRPGPVVTLYELEPAPGTKSSRVIGLADDIARSMSAISARVAVVPGRNAIGIELPNQRREMVYFRELVASQDFEKSSQRLALCMGKTIGGEPVITELAKMPHVLVAGTTGSGKSVAINTMILSLLYRLTPEQCRLIMIDPKMLELSVYDGIPHLLAPVVTDPKKAVVSLKWAVREMEDRYRKMSKVGVRNIDGFNARVSEAKAKGEVILRTVQTGFVPETGEGTFEQEEMSLDTLPYIVVIIDEMADLMMVAGKDIEGAVQRLAQMARAAGIHVIMATQRPSVDVITGTIKANFPTRISFQVTSKIDSRTILGEMGAEQLLGQGDMLYMAGGGRISRVHGPFVSDEEVERVVHHLKQQGRPQYLDAITREEDEGNEESDGGAVFDKGEFGSEDGGDVYEQAVKVVLRDKKASTSYIQRRLQIGYNRAASLMERMEKEGVVGAANHAGKREILIEGDE
jgi:DNA segregation ATPase FtsK/SpoIIIE, S-DNA-T family